MPKAAGLQPSEASSKPCETGTSFFTTGYSDSLEIPGQSECSEILEESADKNSAFSFHTNQSDACENGLVFHTENSAPPTVCIMDLGCTRAMESRKAVEAICRYVDSHPNCRLWYVPLLMSFPQMRNLGFQFELTPDKAYLSCA